MSLCIQCQASCARAKFEVNEWNQAELVHILEVVYSLYTCRTSTLWRLFGLRIGYFIADHSNNWYFTANTCDCTCSGWHIHTWTLFLFHMILFFLMHTCSPSSTAPTVAVCTSHQQSLDSLGLLMLQFRDVLNDEILFTGSTSTSRANSYSRHESHTTFTQRRTNTRQFILLHKSHDALQSLFILS